MQFPQLKQHLMTKQFAPAYLITGEDDFLIEASVNQFKALITQMPELNLSIMQSADDASSIIAALATMPFANDLRLTLIYNFRADATLLEKYFDNPNPHSILVIVAQKPPESLAKILHKLSVIECTKLSEHHITNWVNNALTKHSATIEPGALQLLIQYCEGAMTRISTETHKLAFYKMGGTITNDDVANLVEPSLSYKIFELSEAVATKNGTKTASILQSLLQSGNSPIALLGLLYSHFRRLLYCALDPQNPNLASLLAVKPYAVTLAIKGTKSFTVARLKKICDAFHKIDLRTKIGQLEQRLALESYVFNILI